MKRLPLEQKVAPIREHRAGAIRAYFGTAKQLLEEFKSGLLQPKDRACNNAWLCSSSVMAGPVRLATVSDGVIIMHSPMGCVSNLTQFLAPGMQPKTEIKQDLGGFKPNQPASWYCSNLTEEEVIFGGESKLRETLITVDRRHHPKSIWIFTSCVSGIMGDDIEGIVEETQPEVEAIIVPVRCEAFQSRLCQWGHDAAGHAIMKYLVRKPREKKKDMVNLIASTMILVPDRLYLASLLGKVGIQTNTIPDYAVTESFQVLAEAAASVGICTTWSDYLGIALEQEYGIPFIRDIVPFGIAQTEQWLRRIAQICDKVEEMEVVIEEERARVMPKVKEYRERLQGLRFFMNCGATRTYHVPHMLIDDFGMEMVGITPFEFDETYIVPLENLLKLTGDKDFIVHVADSQTLETVNYLKKLNLDLFLGHRGPQGFVFKQGIPGLHVGAPFPECHGLRQDKNYGMQMGFDGVISYGRYLSKVVSNPSFSENLAAHTKLPYKDSWYEEDPSVNLVDPM